MFVNCPFDNEYFPLLKALLFSICYFDKVPLIAETTDSGSSRLNRIQDLILQAGYSIHDLSRMEPMGSGQLPRFNMPFECGIDFGVKAADRDKFGEKRFLILESERYRYQKVMSDIAGNDIKAHGNQPIQLIKAVHEWFKSQGLVATGYREAYNQFEEFRNDREELMRENGYDPDDISEVPFSDFVLAAQAWISASKS